MNPGVGRHEAMTDSQVANRVLLGAGVAFGSLAVLLVLMEISPAQLWHGGPRFYFGIVGLLVVVADCLYVRRARAKQQSQ